MRLFYAFALATLVHSSPAPPSPEIATNSTLNESPDKSGNQTTIDTASKDDEGIILDEPHAQTDTVNNSTVQPVSKEDSAVEVKVTDDPTTELPTDMNEDKAQSTDKAVNDQQPVENSDSEEDAAEKSDSQQDEKEDEVPLSEESTKPTITTTTEVNTDDEPEVEQPDAKPEPTTTTTNETPVTEKVDNSEDEKSNSEEADTPIEPKEDPSDAQPSNPNYDERTSNALAAFCLLSLIFVLVIYLMKRKTERPITAETRGRYVRLSDDEDPLDETSFSSSSKNLTREEHNLLTNSDSDEERDVWRWS